MSDELPKTKPELQVLRQNLIAAASEPKSSTKQRMDAQLKLAEVNAAIKHINLTMAADAKRDADVRKALGRKEAKANAQRAAERNGRSPSERDTDVLIKAKQLFAELTGYPIPCPAHFHPLMDTLAAFIEAQKAHMNGDNKETERDSWQQTWSEPKEG